MDKNASYRIVKETFENEFNKERFLLFTKNLCNKIDESKAFHAHGYVPEVFKSYVKTYERLATYTDPEGKKIDILIVYLQKESSLERARTAQRNFVARYLKDRDQKDAGFVAFVAPDPKDWRFSLIKMEYKFSEGKSGKIKVKEEFTPARRWSFLVGSHENSHTAQSRLAPILQEDEHNPTLDVLEECFNIEKVTKEFFEKYRDLFLQVKETLDDIVKKDPAIKRDFTDKGVDNVDFSKKLLGQIVFLYFLQKKGWFGVDRDCGWGTGPKNFLRQLFEQKHGAYKNFFNDILEPLFYEALARERDDDFYSRFNCKIPFLNGGLFDPINNYDWVHTDILMPNDLFSNTRKTKEGDIGNGILDVFDRYNFTVKEDEPLEKEVAVDPEMLGKVFENLLEVKDRKSKGTYYTPREIVHYMCVQSLVNYLATELDGKVSKEDCEKLIKYGESVGENEARVEEKGEETQTYYYKLPESIRANAKLIDEWLANIKVCDPAIGSGAFPVGMMTEIVRTRNVLSSYIKEPGRTLYNFKRDCIHNSLYGVDIDPSAVEIAKLRLWLSLVVDEDDIRQIKPLPNLDYKIMQGNSLLEEHEGVRLFDDKLLSTVNFDKEKQVADLKEKISELSSEYIKLHQANRLNREKKVQIDEDLKKLNAQLKKAEQTGRRPEENASLFDVYSTAKKKADELKRLHKEFSETTQKSKKDNLKKQIERLGWDLIETTLKEQNKTAELKKLEVLKKDNIKPFFLWKLHFAEVFQDGGFDVVIANPPYVNIEKIGESDRKLYLKIYGEDGKLGKRYDIYQLFLMKGVLLLKKDGVLSYILPNTFLMGSSYLILRRRICQNSSVLSLVDLPQGVFDATVDNVLLFLQNNELDNNKINVFKLNTDSDILNLSSGSWDDSFFILQDVLGEHNEYKFNVHMNPTLEALFKKIECESERLGEITESSQGIIIYKTEEDAKRNKYTSFKMRNDWKKLLRGTNIGYYCTKWDGEYIHYGNWLWCARDEKYFNQPKILLQAMRNKSLRRRLIATYDKDLFYNAHNLANIIAKPTSEYDLKYILAIFNSALINFWYRNHFPNVNINPGDFRQIPVRKAQNQKPFIGIVDRILALTKSDGYKDGTAKQAEVAAYIKELDQMVFKLYGLSLEESEMIEESGK